MGKRWSLTIDSIYFVYRSELAVRTRFLELGLQPVLQDVGQTIGAIVTTADKAARIVFAS